MELCGVSVAGLLNQIQSVKENRMLGNEKPEEERRLDSH